MYLICDFSVSQFIPKSAANSKVRDTAAKLLKESRIFAKKNKLNLVEHDGSHIIPKLVTERDQTILGYTKKGQPRKMSSIGITPLSEAKVSYLDKLRKPYQTPSNIIEKARGYQADALDVPITKMGKYIDDSGKERRIFGNLSFTQAERKKTLDELSNRYLIKAAKKDPVAAKENDLETLSKLKLTKTRKLGLDKSDEFNKKISRYILSEDGYDILKARDALSKEANRYSKEKGFDIPRLPGKYT